MFLNFFHHSFSTTALRSAEQPTPDRPQIGASSLFENIQVEAEEKLAQHDGKDLTEKQVKNPNQPSIWPRSTLDLTFFSSSINSLPPI